MFLGYLSISSPFLVQLDRVRLISPKVVFLGYVLLMAKIK